MKVFVTRKIPQIAIDILIDSGIDVIVHRKDRLVSKSELLKNGRDSDGLITFLSDKIDEDFISILEKCKVIANYAVGYNNIDLEKAAEKKIIITNTPDVLTDATADLSLTLLLSCARRIIEGHNLVINNKFSGWKADLLTGMGFRGKTLGIIGAGRIGTAVANRAKSFGLKIAYFNSRRNEVLEKETGAKKYSLENLLKRSDFISIHLPLNEKTYHLLNKEKLCLLKNNAIVINTARGEIVDEKALIQLLKQKKIFAAGFDVYENEPNVNKELLKLKNVVLLPHIGSATIETRNEMAILCAKNIINVFKGKKPITRVS